MKKNSISPNRGILLITIFSILFLDQISAQWTQVAVPTLNTLNCVEYVNNDTIYAGSKNELLRSVDGGMTWNLIPITGITNPTIDSVLDIHFFNGNTGVITGITLNGALECILRTTDGGANWSVVFLNVFPGGFYKFCFFAPTTGIAIGKNGKILRTTDSGISWTTVASGTNLPLRDLHFFNQNNGIIVGTGVVLKTINGGVNWSITSTNGFLKMRGVHFLNDNVGYAIGSFMWMTANGGTTWSTINNTPGGNDIYALNTRLALAFGSSIRRTNNGGSTWINDYSNNSISFFDFDFNGTLGFAVGDSGSVFRFSDENDAGATALSVEGICLGSAKVKLINYGTNILNTATLHLSINGVECCQYNWMGNLDPGGITDYVELNGIPIQNTGDDLGAWTSNPNGFSDQDSRNDSYLLNYGGFNYMSGTYTIGGTNADYATFSAASSALRSRGMCGPVIFEVVPGVYLNDYIYLNDVFGNSSSNTITFRSLATDSTAVKLVNNSTSNSSYVIQLQGTDYVSIEYMTIERDFGNGTGNTIFINSGVNNFTVKSCRVLGARISSSSGIHASARFESNFIKATFVVSALNGIIFRKNTIDQSTIIFLSFNTGLICNNDFEDCEVYINNANLCRVENNYFSETQLSLTDNLVINISNSICNNVFVSDNTVPLSIRSINTLIAYNSFRVDDVSCMLFTNSRNIGNNRFINNNLFRLNGSGIITYNEIGFNTSFALQFQQFDYNNYYTYSSDYTYILNQFQANFGKDLHSTVINPVFTSSTDLHMQNMALSGTGLPISGLNFDLDSTLRNTLHPTVGAYETFADSTFEELVDLEIIGIPSIQVGVNMVKVKVCQKIVSSPYSFVADIDSLHLQIIYGNFNTNQFTEYLDTLLEISVDVLKPSDTIVYTFNEQIDIPKGRSMMFNFMASYKNNIYETQLSNNELSILYNLPMLGVYTVGGANGDFDSIAHAQRNIRLCGAFGDGVTFNIRPGAYHLNPVGDPIFTDGPKNESPSTVFYRSESGNRNDVILYCSRMSACNDFGFRNVTFIAYDDTITDFETNYDHRGIEIFASHNLSFDSCLFHSANTFNSYSGLSFINCGSMTIRNCDFKNLYAGVYYPNAMYEPNQNQTYGLHQIENCTFDSVDYGIKCNSHNWLFASQLELMNNHIRSFFESIHYQSFPYASPLNMLVHNNDCISESGGGLYISRQNNINRVEIVNNFFAGDSALSINECEVVFNHNSCRSSSFFRQASKLEAFNNSFYSDSAVPAFVFISDNPINNSSFDCNLNCLDYNNYYTEDSSLVLVIDLDGSNYDSYSIQDSQSKLGSDSNSVSVNPSYVSSHDLHTQTSALVGLGKNVNVLIDIDGEPRDPFQPNIGADEFYPLLAYVWPGDADNNGIVNAFDLFPIGVHYYDSGYSRSVQNTIWSAHLATDWPTYQFNAQNKKYADCNGDGIINSDDVPSITQNYLFSHNAANMQLQTSVNGEPRLFFKGANGVQHPGDTVTLELWLGQSSNQLAAIYSVGADFTFSSGLIASESMSFTMDSAWIDPVEGLSIVKLNETAGTGQFSATRVSQTDTSGFGRLGVLKFQIATSIMQDTMAEFQFSGYIALNSVGTPINLRFGIKEINIHANNARVAAQIYGDSLRTIRLYPNPVTSSATLQIETEANEPIEIIINDVNGRAVYGFMAKEVITGISYYEIYPVQWGLTSGLYLVNVYSKGNLLNSIRLAVN